MIPALPASYVEHLVAPRRLGDLTDAEAAGERGSMVGGLGVRVTLAWRMGDGGAAVIDRAAARCLGSPAAIAPASWLMARVEGLTAETAEAVRSADVMSGLGAGPATPLPEAVSRGAVFVVDALRAALGAAAARPADPTGPGLLVCRCLGIGDREIAEAIAAGADSPEAVGDLCRAGTGCRSCRPDVLQLLHEAAHPVAEAPPQDLPDVARIAWALLRPMLQAHGHALRDVTMTETGVGLELSPTVPRPSVSPQGAQALARHALRETVGDAVEVSVRAARGA